MSSPITLKVWMFLLVIWFVITGYPPAASAQSPGCFQSFKKCYDLAVRRPNWDDRLLSSLDCELDFVECARKKIIGR